MSLGASAGYRLVVATAPLTLKEKPRAVDIIITVIQPEDYLVEINQPPQSLARILRPNQAILRLLMKFLLKNVAGVV
jgi:hypothetical protein